MLEIVVDFQWVAWYYGALRWRTATMPRKPKPSVPLVIEGLSDGRVVRPKAFVDDFTQELVPAKANPRPSRELTSAQAMRDADNRARLAAQRALLQQTGIIPAPTQAKLVAPAIAGMRPVATDGATTVYLERKPWRRI